MTHKADREKVIKECEWAIGRIEDYGSTTMTSRLFFADVIKLLKEQHDTIDELQNAYGYLQKQFFEVQDKSLKQEAVEPILIREGRNKYYNDYVCPGCDNELNYGQNYCSECGRRMKWE